MRAGWRARWLAAVLATLASAAAACPPGEGREVAVVRLSDGRVLATVPAAEGFALGYRHSVTLTPVLARYAVDADGGLRQVEERFVAHGPGLAHDGEGWRREGDAFVLPLDRPLDRLVLRSDPRWENRLVAGGTVIALSRWPRQPLEILALPCQPPPEPDR